MSVVRVFEEMLGRTCWQLEGKRGGNSLRFTMQDGSVFEFYHRQDCCESVVIDDVVGDLQDLLAHPLLEAEEISSEGHPGPNTESFTWTFYRFSTVKGTATVRWLGVSNGYYSESVEYDEELKPRQAELSPSWSESYNRAVDATTGHAKLVEACDDELEKLEKEIDG